MDTDSYNVAIDLTDPKHRAQVSRPQELVSATDPSTELKCSGASNWFRPVAFAKSHARYAQGTKPRQLPLKGYAPSAFVRFVTQ
ncbi:MULTISPECIES: hypothetical protein [unclassified Lentimonas]|uniref:hypothetical protein n=1 Tax=unclassified Lentimonas TaxID=2630993 RepID=UPI001320D26F|nr:MULTISPECIES: hypothetical protein [unclassified Lentimonas]CAA6692144.1 Unannotated [Lentimonas sp. CC19]CAA6694460.1 Unannotated [Lentimonas sp. CC10]CAA7070603.1 Unannotated [Lentimonas sp. CC11]